MKNSIGQKPNKRKSVKHYSAKKRIRKRELIDLGREKLKIEIDFSILKKVLQYGIEIAIVCGIAWFLVTFYGQRVSTVGDSMSPVLTNADVVFVNRLSYNMSNPKRGDIIVFKPKGNENSHYYIKRVVGLPGETISILEDAVYINGTKLEEEYETTDINDVGILSEELELGEDEYFVLGDDRENSEDSRSNSVGLVKKSYIYGKAWFVISPLSDFGFIKE